MMSRRENSRTSHWSLVSTWPTNFQPGFPGKMDLSETSRRRGGRKKWNLKYRRGEDSRNRMISVIDIKWNFISNWKCSYFYPYLLLHRLSSDNIEQFVDNYQLFTPSKQFMKILNILSLTIRLLKSINNVRFMNRFNFSLGWSNRRASSYKKWK